MSRNELYTITHNLKCTCIMYRRNLLNWDRLYFIFTNKNIAARHLSVSIPRWHRQIFVKRGGGKSGRDELYTPHWATKGLDFPFWWTSQKCIFIILGYCWPYLTEKSTLRFSMSNFEICEKWLGSWWNFEILENFIFVFNTFP